MSRPSDLPTTTGDPSPAPAAAVRRPRDLAVAAAALFATFAVGLAGGYAAKLLNFPLPYMTGSLIVTAALGLSGVPVRSLWAARTAGQFVTGAAIGTTFTPSILVTIITLLPLIVFGAVVSIAVGGVGALILMRIAHLDAKTAFLATLPGGVIEMANVAQRIGADQAPITVLQTMRVGLTVCAAPFLVTWLAGGTRGVVLPGETMSWLLLAALMAASSVGGYLLHLIKSPNAWFLGSLLVMAVLGALGLIEGRVPDLILVIAQVIIGVSIGTQFRKEFLTRLLRLLLASLVTVPFALIAMALVAAVYSFFLGLPLPTLVLSLAPAGIAEMALTAKVLGLDGALVTGFQMVRIVLVILLAAPACRLFMWMLEKRG